MFTLVPVPGVGTSVNGALNRLKKLAQAMSCKYTIKTDKRRRKGGALENFFKTFPLAKRENKIGKHGLNRLTMFPKDS